MSHYHEEAIDSEIQQKIAQVYEQAIVKNVLRLRKFRENGWISADTQLDVLDALLAAKTIRGQTKILNIFFDKLLCNTST